jgi:tRNA G26 N,N-dimethylase Trm1
LPWPENTLTTTLKASGPPVTDKCEHCGCKHQMGGPIWADPICDVDFIDRVVKSINNKEEKLSTAERIEGMLRSQYLMISRVQCTENTY